MTLRFSCELAKPSYLSKRFSNRFRPKQEPSPKTLIFATGFVLIKALLNLK
jgi:hypothetical protein